MTHILEPAARGLFRQILEDPSDDLPRMLLADWLTEKEDPRGEWIRYSIREGVDFTMNGNSDSAENIVKIGWGITHAEFWIGLGYDQKTKYQAFRGYKMPRGFVSSVTFHTTRDFLRMAQALFLSHPVTEVRLTDKRPEREGVLWEFRKRSHDGTVSPKHDYLPTEIFDQLPASEDGFIWSSTSRELAEDLLSKACVRYGRALVGLPDISGFPPFGEGDLLVGKYHQYADVTISYCQCRTPGWLVMMRNLDNTELINTYNEWSILTNWKTIPREKALEWVLERKWK